MVNSTRIKIIFVSIISVSLFLVACSTKSMQSDAFAEIPAGLGYADGKEIYFTHTESSDPGIADKLTNMMDSPVIYVPSLADVPETALAKVYVFENGVKGMGPLGFQSDVFNNPPGADGYSPLRQIILVKWADGVEAVVLKSEDEVLKSESDGLITLTKSGVVVNMPFIVWDGGKR